MFFVDVTMYALKKGSTSKSRSDIVLAKLDVAHLADSEDNAAKSEDWEVFEEWGSAVDQSLGQCEGRQLNQTKPKSRNTKKSTKGNQPASTEPDSSMYVHHTTYCDDDPWKDGIDHCYVDPSNNRVYAVYPDGTKKALGTPAESRFSRPFCRFYLMLLCLNGLYCF